MKRNALTLLIVLLSTLSLSAQNWRAGIHDPSTIVKCKDRYWVFGTGDGIHAMYSYDLVTWSNGPSPFTKTNFPAWINNYVKGGTDSNGNAVFHGGFWAPDIIYMNNQYYLYYSCSEWGTMTSTIGCVTNKTLDPDDPDYAWKDVGFLGIWSYQPGLALNAIDPAIYRGADDKIWMAYGSFNERGIVVTELDSISGKPKNYTNNLPGTSVANSWTGPRASDYAEGEGATVIYRDGYYYLFYNKGGCCAGVNSSYYVVMGRSTSPKGPFVDKAGKNLRSLQTPSGGTVVFRHDDSRGYDDRFYGPGHFGIFHEEGTDYVSFHYYDPNWGYPGQPAGGPTMGLAKLVWGEDGWPSVTMNFVEEGIYTLRNSNSNKMMDIHNHQAINGAEVWQYAENPDYDSQKWMLTSLGTGEYTLQNMADPTLYLEAAGNDNDEFLRVTSNFTGAIHQKFRLIEGTDGRVVIYPSISDKFIEIPNAYTTDSRVILWPNTNHACQRWQLTRQDAPVSLPETSLPEALKISPNPASTHLWVEGAAPDATVVVLTMDGKEVLRQKLQGSISIAHLPAGPYLLKVVDPEGSRLQKFVIQP